MLSAYIDPGTGSMLFTILLGAITTLYFFAQKFFFKIKFRLSGGKVEKMNANKLPFVIFSDGKQYWNVFEPICDEFEKRKVKLSYWTASPDDPALEKKYEYVTCEFIGEGNHAFSRLNMMNAGIVLATTPGLDVLQWKRSRNVDWYVHTLHAAGTSAAGYRMFSLDYYDAVLLTGAFQIDEIRELEHKRNLPEKELAVLGCTYMDRLYQRLKNTPASEHEGTTVLLAPSWGASGILNRFGSRMIDSLLATGYNIIIRPHPQSFRSEKDLMDELMKKYPDSDRVHWDRSSDNFVSLHTADIMISDFSSVIFDYTLIFNKPILYTENTFVKDPYDAAWLDEDMWKFKVLPEIGMPLKEEDIPRLKEVIDGAIASDTLSAGRDKARSEAWAHIGESAALTADYMIRKQKELAEKAGSVSEKQAGSAKLAAEV